MTCQSCPTPAQLAAGRPYAQWQRTWFCLLYTSTLPAIAGEKRGALGITEPGAGADVASIRTCARKVPGGWVVNGAKTFITNGVRADFLVCAVKTSDDGGHHGISFLLLERDMPGYEVSRKLEKMGWLASDTGELAFTDVE